MATRRRVIMTSPRRHGRRKPDRAIDDLFDRELEPLGPGGFEDVFGYRHSKVGRELFDRRALHRRSSDAAFGTKAEGGGE